MKIAVLDDYQHLALRFADWSRVQAQAAVKVFDRHLEPDEAAAALAEFEAICLMRERMPMPRALIERLPRLKCIAITGEQNRTLDLAAATERRIVVSGTAPVPNRLHATPELAWGLMLSFMRHIAFEDAAMRAGRWQSTVGTMVYGKTLGLLGLGRIGRRMAEYGKVFGMQVIAWSQNLTDEAARAAGATRVEKAELFRASDVVSIHLVLSERTRRLVAAPELGAMKPTAVLVNTSRGPIVDEADLIAALRARRIAGAALDVYDIEPLPADHPLRALDNVVLSPHLGYVVEQTMRAFYADTVEALEAFIAGTPVRVLNPEVLGRSGSES